MFIVHVHISSKPDVCFWLRAIDGSLTRDVALAFEFNDPKDAVEAIMNACQDLNVNTAVPGVQVVGVMHHFSPDTLPQSIRTLIRVD